FRASGRRNRQYFQGFGFGSSSQRGIGSVAVSTFVANAQVGRPPILVSERSTESVPSSSVLFFRTVRYSTLLAISTSRGSAKKRRSCRRKTYVFFRSRTNVPSSGVSGRVRFCF